MDSNALNPVEPRQGVPLYVAVRDAIREAVDGGRLEPGDKLPSTKALSEQMSVSLVTVHRALQELVAGGVLHRGQGRGTYVHEHYMDRAGQMTDCRFGIVFHAQSSLADAYHGQIIEGVRQGASELGIDLVILRFGEDWRNECQGYLYVNPFAEQLEKPPRYVGSRSRAAVKEPVMVIGAHYEGVSSIDVDNRKLARNAAERLAELGHTRVAFVGSTTGCSNNIDRWDGFREAAERLGFEDVEDLSVRVSGWRAGDDGRTAISAMLSRADRPTAVFAAGYYFALDTYAAASGAGLRVGRDVAVLGVDDTLSAELLDPPLTTFRQPLIKVGRAAVTNMFEMIRDEEPATRRITLDPELMIRGSDGPAG